MRYASTDLRRRKNRTSSPVDLIYDHPHVRSSALRPSVEFPWWARGTTPEPEDSIIRARRWSAPWLRPIKYRQPTSPCHIHISNYADNHHHHRVRRQTPLWWWRWWSSTWFFFFIIITIIFILFFYYFLVRDAPLTTETYDHLSRFERE